jgi:adenosylhomocysteine nucleosidase
MNTEGKQIMKIGIMGAMAEEISLLRHHLSETQVETRGMREYVSGQLRHKTVTVAFSRWGKVAASSTATTLIERYGVDCLVFTGVAGALDPVLDVGDIVIADTLIQHDIDASPIPGIEKYEVPLLGLSRFKVEQRHVAVAQRAANLYLERDFPGDVPEETRREFGITKPKVVVGTIASGDQFIADDTIAQELRAQIPGLLCVEMEGAAVAQVAYEHGIPCIVLRTISDRADHQAAIDFPRFVSGIASHFTCGSVLRLLDSLAV